MGSCMRLAEKRTITSKNMQNTLPNRVAKIVNSNVFTQIKRESEERFELIEKIYSQKLINAPILRIEGSSILNRRTSLELEAY